AGDRRARPGVRGRAERFPLQGYERPLARRAQPRGARRLRQAPGGARAARGRGVDRARGTRAVILGRIREVWRYPVKSMMGESLPAAEVDPGGIPGDRAWAVRDEVRGGIRGAKKIAGLMRCAAAYLEAPTRSRVPAPQIVLPDGTSAMASSPDAA